MVIWLDHQPSQQLKRLNMLPNIRIEKIKNYIAGLFTLGIYAESIYCLVWIANNPR
jgi:hypothetical protein